MLVAALAAIVFEVTFAPRAAHRALDPDEPIAADGSMIAGKARTIYDTNPLLGVFGEPPRPDPDDPRDFEQRIAIEKWGTDHARDAMAQQIGPVDGSLCEPSVHTRLMTALHRLLRRPRPPEAQFLATRPARHRGDRRKSGRRRSIGGSMSSCAGRCCPASCTRTRC